MRILSRKSRPERLLQHLAGFLEIPSSLKPSRTSRIRAALPGPTWTGPAGHPLKTRLPDAAPRTTGLVAGGLAGLTAGSAGISALRRRKEGAGDRS